MTTRLCYSLLLGVSLATGGCSGTIETPVSTETTNTVEFNTVSAPVVEFNVPDMMCAEGCGAKTKEILSKQPGARDVLVDFESKTVYVAVDEERFSAEEAVAALVDHGFDNSSQKRP